MTWIIRGGNYGNCRCDSDRADLCVCDNHKADEFDHEVVSKDAGQRKVHQLRFANESGEWQVHAELFQVWCGPVAIDSERT